MESIEPILVSNRGPQAKSLHEIVLDASGGGLQTVLSNMVIDTNGIWICLSMTDDEREIFIRHSKRDFSLDGHRITLRKPALDTETFNKHYKFSNEFSWPLFHFTYERLDKKVESFPTPKFDFADYFSHIAVNRIISEFTLEEVISDYLVGSSRPIAFHDFHTILSMKYLRESAEKPGLKLPPIGFFLHTPFFDIDLVEDIFKDEKDPFKDKLLKYFLSDIVDSFASADLVGFQIDVYRKKFIKLVKKKFSHKYEVNEEEDAIIDRETGHKTKLGVYPVGVDLGYIDKVVKGNPLPNYDLFDIGRDMKKFENMDALRIVQIGRGDYTKGIEYGMEVNSRLVEMNLPSRLYTIAAKSRSNIEAYKKLQQIYIEVNRRVNKEHKLKVKNGGRIHTYAHSRLFTHPIKYDEGLKLHAHSVIDLTLNNNDGCCLVIPETVQARKNNRYGLIVCGISGAAKILKDEEKLDYRDGILFVDDPTKPDEIARNIYQIMTQSNPHLSDKLFKAIEKRFNINTSHVEPFFNDLENCRKAA